jgi:hypothetical protein
VGVRETVPAGIEKIGGIVLRNFTLKGLGSDSAYIYKLFIPLNTTLTGFNITAVGRVNSRDYEVSTSSYIKIRKNVSSTTSGSSGTTGTGSGSGNTGTGVNAGDIGADGVVVTSNPPIIDDAKAESGFRRFFRNVEKFFVNLFS